MFHRVLAQALFFVAIFSGLSPRVMADTYISDKDDSVKRRGIAYNIAEDRKVENINGVYEPEGLDKYMKRYIDKLSMKVDELSAKIEKLSEQVAQLSPRTDAFVAKKDAAASSGQAKLI